MIKKIERRLKIYLHVTYKALLIPYTVCTASYRGRGRPGGERGGGEVEEGREGVRKALCGRRRPSMI